MPHVAKVTHQGCFPLCPGGRCSGDVWVSTQIGPGHRRWPRGSQGWLHHGRTQAGLYTAGSTARGPSHGGLWSGRPWSQQCTVWSWRQISQFKTEGIKSHVSGILVSSLCVTLSELNVTLHWSLSRDFLFYFERFPLSPFRSLVLPLCVTWLFYLAAIFQLKSDLSFVSVVIS